jgi:uncharacterized protein with ACT and thioredoxin-like domain
MPNIVSSNHRSATHFISTSVYSGIDLTATQLFHDSRTIKSLSHAMEGDVYLRSSWLYLTEPLQIGLVHLLEISHIGQENINLNHFL